MHDLIVLRCQIGEPVEPEPANTGGGKGTGIIHPYPLAAMEDDMKHLLFAAGILSATSAMADDVPELTVYTYDSFVSDWGPGPQVEEAFEAVCNCDLKLVGIEDGAALLSRIRLELSLIHI